MPCMSYIQVLGRIDDTVKIRGYKVGMTYIAGAVRELPAVGNACIVPVMNEASGLFDNLAAHIVPSPAFQARLPTLLSNDAADGSNMVSASSIAMELEKTEGRGGHHAACFAHAVRTALVSIVPHYAVPKFFIVHVRLPTKEGSGKLDKQRLPVPASQASAQATFAAAEKAAAAAAEMAEEAARGVTSTSTGAAGVAASSRLATAVRKAWVETLRANDESAGNNAPIATATATGSDNFFQVGCSSMYNCSSCITATQCVTTAFRSAATPCWRRLWWDVCQATSG